MAADTALNTELTLAKIWKDVLQRPDDLSGSDRFFELGGDSVSMMMLLFRVDQALHVEVTPEQMFENDTFQGMVANIEKLRASY
jgi:acyl carrier protein